MSVINKLTAEQEARLPEFRDKWINIGLGTVQQKPEDCIKDINNFLLAIKWPTRPVILLDGPVSSWIAVNKFVASKQVWDQVEDQVWDQVEDQVKNQVRDQVRDQVEDQVEDQIESQVWSQVGNQVWNQVGNQVWNQVGDQIRNQVERQVGNQIERQVRDQVEDQVWDQVRGQVWDQVRGQVWNQIENQIEEMIWPYLWGGFDAAYYSLYDTFFSSGIGKYDKEVLDKFYAYSALHKYRWIWILKDVVIVCNNPLSITKNEHGLHCDGGPSIEFADGLRCWNLNGVSVPRWLAEEKATDIDPRKFSEIKNVEVRREFVRKIGMERIVDKLKPTVLDKQADYELLEINLKGETGKWPYLKMLNPSIGIWHLECVDRSCKTVDEALNWRNQSTIKPEVLT